MRLCKRAQRFFAVCVSLLLLSCAPEKVELSNTTFERDLIQFEFASEVQIAMASLLFSGSTISTQHLGFSAKKLSFPVPWEAGENYTLVVNKADTFRVTAPKRRAEAAQMSIHLPLGQREIALGESDSISFPFKNGTRLALFLPKNTQTASAVWLKLRATQAIFSGEFERDTVLNLEKYAAKNYVTFPLNLENKSDINLTVSARINDGEIFSSVVEAQHLSADQAKAELLVSKVQLPTSATGDFRQFDEPFTLRVGDPWLAAIRRFFQVDKFSKNLSTPVSFATIELQNTSGEERFFLGEIRFFGPKTGKEHPAFAPTNWEQNGFTKAVKRSLRLAAGETGKLVLPIYIDDEKLPLGEFRGDVRVSLLGSGAALHTEAFALRVSTVHHLRLLLFLAVVALGFFGFLRFVWNYKKIEKSIELRIIIAVAIFAAIQFAVNYSLTLLDSSVFSILGPFKIFLSGFFSESLTYAVLVSLYMVFPKRGVIELKLVASFLLGLVLSGGFYITMLSTLGMNMLAYGLIFSLYTSEKINRFWLVLTLLGIYDASRSYFSLLEMQVLYDLHYATWYIWLYVIVIGFFYTLLGGLLGRFLGRNFKKVISY